MKACSRRAKNGVPGKKEIEGWGEEEDLLSNLNSLAFHSRPIFHKTKTHGNACNAGPSG